MTTESEELQHPLPYASWETRGWWEGCGREELVLQSCNACGAVQHKPRAVCATCLSNDLAHTVANGTGVVHTFTVTNQNQARPFVDHCPYVLAYVELDEGPRVLTNIVGCDAADVSIGMSVIADFQHGERDDGESFAVPRFRPA